MSQFWTKTEKKYVEISLKYTNLLNREFGNETHSFPFFWFDSSTNCAGTAYLQGITGQST